MRFRTRQNGQGTRRPDWLHEVKYDGYQMMVIREQDRVLTKTVPKKKAA